MQPDGASGYPVAPFQGSTLKQSSLLLRRMNLVQFFVTWLPACRYRASALSAGSSHTQINIDLPVFESRRPVTASQRMRMAAAEGRQFVFFLTSLNVNNHVLSGVRYTLGAHGPVRINFL